MYGRALTRSGRLGFHPQCQFCVTSASAKADVDAAKPALLQAERKATTESPLKAPVWLLPSGSDVVAFMAIWTGPTDNLPSGVVKNG